MPSPRSLLSPIDERMEDLSPPFIPPLATHTPVQLRPSPAHLPSVTLVDSEANTSAEQRSEQRSPKSDTHMSSLYSAAKMVDSTKVKFDLPIGTWGHTEVEVEYPWHRDLDSIILPLLETAHESQAERQRKHYAAVENGGREGSKRHSKKRSIKDTPLPARPHEGGIGGGGNPRDSRLGMESMGGVGPGPGIRVNEEIRVWLKGRESAKEVVMLRGEQLQKVMEVWAKEVEKDPERLELFYKGKHVKRVETPENLGLEDGSKFQIYELVQ